MWACYSQFIQLYVLCLDQKLLKVLKNTMTFGIKTHNLLNALPHWIEERIACCSVYLLFFLPSVSCLFGIRRQMAPHRACASYLRGGSYPGINDSELFGNCESFVIPSCNTFSVASHRQRILVSSMLSDLNRSVFHCAVSTARLSGILLEWPSLLSDLPVITGGFKQYDGIVHDWSFQSP